MIRFRTSQLSESGAASPSGWEFADLGDLLFGRLRCFHGVLPPLHILNAMLLVGSFVNTENLGYVWTPVELDDSAYARLRRDFMDHPEWGEIEDHCPSDEADWGHWAFVRSLTKLRRNGS